MTQTSLTQTSLTQTRIRAGMWEGIWSGPVHSGPVEPPALEVVLLEVALPGLSVTPVPGQAGDWAVRIAIPAAVLSDGVQTFVIRDPAEGARLGHFTIITGVAMEDDLRAEVDLLRAELDMLKRAFRRHCVETLG